ncbi:MAG: MCP four helix bundle domain-containing protein [Chloroflexi bacterium]|nr:MCP four helix bundle domain-containing protein [Chloroflexota bacterium]
MTLSIRLKLVLAFNIFLIALAVLGYFVYRHLDRSRDLSSDVSGVLTSRVEYVSELDDLVNRLRFMELAYLTEADPSLRASIGGQTATTIGDVDSTISRYRATIDGEPPASLTRFEEDYGAYLQEREQVAAAVNAGRMDDAWAAFNASGPYFQKVSDAVFRLHRDAHADAQAAASHADSLLGELQFIMIGGLAAASLLIFAVGHPLSTGIHRRLRELLDGIRRVSRGELDQPMAVRGSDEIAVVASSFNTMMESLRSARDEVSALHRQALDMQEERISLLRGRMAQVVRAQEEERRRVARELHDQAGQVLTALQMGLSRLQTSGPTPEVEALAASLREMALEAMNEVRNLALDLRPSALDELGLPGALKDYVETFSSRTGLPAELKVSGAQRRLSAEAEATLFRIAQEGLTNVAKHSQASRVLVSLSFADPTLHLVVEDDGVGFDAERALGSDQYNSLGLLGIQERCHLLGADLQIRSRPQEGTKLMVSLKMAPNAAPASDCGETKLEAA